MNKRPRMTIGEWLFAMSVCTLGCILFPTLVTAMLPVTYLKLTRQGDEVTAHAKTCLLLVIPYRTQSLQNVLEAATDVIYGEVGEAMSAPRDSQDRTIRMEDSGTLTLSSGDKKIQIPLTPANLYDYQRDVRDFIEGSGSPEASGDQLTRFCVANWKGSIFAGVPLTMLTLLFVVAVAHSWLTQAWEFLSGTFWKRR